MERSVGMILIIPFAICFILLFLVCCFADEMKKMCILPSQIPPSYRSSSPVFNTGRQHESYSASSTLQNNRLDPDDIENQSLAVEQAETEQLITDDLILTRVDIPAQISIRTNTISNLHYNTMNNNNHHDNCHQSTTNNNNNNIDDDDDDDDDNENRLADSIQQEYQYSHNVRRSSSSSSIFLENSVCIAINRSSQHSDYVLSRHISDISGVGIEEAETSLIPPIIFRGSLQHLQQPNNSICSDYPAIFNHEPNLVSSCSADATASVKQRECLQVSVSINNLNTTSILSHGRLTTNVLKEPDFR